MHIAIEKLDEVWCRVTGEFAAIEQLAEHFTFEVPGSQFSPKHINNGGMWDGSIRLLNRMNGLLYAGLAAKAYVMASELGFKVSIDPRLRPDSTDYTAKIEQFIEQLDLPFDPHDFQVGALNVVLQRKRGLILSPTSSGKSLIIYFIAKYLGLKTLIISPRKGLVKQMESDLKEYGYSDPIHTVMAGSAKATDDLITISTWQSIYKLPKKYFNQYDVIIGDEVHLFDSMSLTGIMLKTTEVEYKVGLTGSLKGTKTHELVLTGLFGGKYRTITTREMIDRGISSDVEIIVIVFVHGPDSQSKLPAKHTYLQEDDAIIQNDKRNKYIAELVKSLEGNTLLMFRKIAKHGDELNKLLVNSGKPVHYIHGKVDVDEREAIRQLIETVDGHVVQASSGTSSTGISMKNLQNMIQTNAIKSRIDMLQSLGRGLRKDGKANKLKFFDLADKFVRENGKKKEDGYAYRHLLERLQVYTEEQLPYKIIEIPIN
jgi:superfamily II DNA or RNA helicase